MRECHCLDTDLNRRRDFTGRRSRISSESSSFAGIIKQDDVQSVVDSILY